MQTVTQLDERRRSKRHPDGKRLRAVGERFQQMVPVLLDSFFSQVDDFLFNLAEKGGVDSTDYFNVLRVMRRRKVDIRQSIIQEIDEWLTGGAQKAVASEKEGADEQGVDFDSLTLMDDIELDRSLAVDSFVVRTFEHSGDEWLAFRERMTVLTCAKQLRDRDTPYNPVALGQIVLSQLESVDAPFSVTLMMFRLFDDLAIQSLVNFYRSSNIWLIDEGILPNLKLLQRSQNPSSRNVNAETIAQLSAALAEAQPGGYPGAPSSFSQVRGPFGAVPEGSMTSVGAGAARFSNSSGMMINQEMLQQMMSSMSHIQTMPAPMAHDLPELKNWTSKQAEVVARQARGTLEAGTVSLVAMLFEYILDDENLSAHMKQLLARMQIPVIKVALMDKDFFTNTDHTARLLLNRMSRAASGWRPDARLESDPLLDGMEKIVSQLNHAFDDDLTIFDTLLDEFDNLLNNYRKQQQYQLADIRKVEEQAFEEHQNQDRALLFIDALLEGEQLPKGIESLLRTHWYRLMKNIFTKQGDSKTWRNSARIARELVWSLQPGVQLSQASRFSQVVPKLLEAVAGGLKAVGLSEAAIGSAMTTIQQYHEKHQKPSGEGIWDAQEKLEQFSAQTEKAEALVEEVPPLPVDEPVVELKVADLSYYMDQVEALVIDQWFDIELADGRVERGCLTMIIGGGSKYVFTNYTGEKIAERSAIGLAMSLRNEQFVLIDDDPLMDRMIESVVADLDKASKPDLNP
ncbi:MAG: DUF1631 family protein [Reinekea sp.]